jgi:hypothetical protein
MLPIVQQVDVGVGVGVGVGFGVGVGDGLILSIIFLVCSVLCFYIVSGDGFVIAFIVQV